MKSLVFADTCANRDNYVLALPDAMDRWSMSGLHEFLAQPQSSVHSADYLPTPLDPLHFEQCRQLLTSPPLTMNVPPFLEQDDTRLGEEDTIQLPSEDTVVLIDREDAPFDELVEAVSVAARNRLAYDSCHAAIVRSIDTALDLEHRPVHTPSGATLKSFDSIVPAFERLAPDTRLRFIYRAASALYEAPFENISRIVQRRQSRPGYAVWENIAAGNGGVCAEKTAALGLVCDVLGLSYVPVLGAEQPLPDDYDERVAAYVRCGGGAQPPPWAQHHLLQIEIDGEHFLVDVTNGNLPMLFLDEADAQQFLASGLRLRMVYNTEKIQLKRFSRQTGDILLTLSEFHIPDLHLQYIFDQGLGLQIAPDAFIGVYYDCGGASSRTQQQRFSTLARRAGFPYPRFIHENNVGSIPDPTLQKTLTDVLLALRQQFTDRSYSGSFTFVLQPIRNNFWRQPRVSTSVQVRVTASL